jgi:hypothetical protein
VQLWGLKRLQTRSEEVGPGTAVHDALQRFEQADLALSLTIAPGCGERVTDGIEIP